MHRTVKVTFDRGRFTALTADGQPIRSTKSKGDLMRFLAQATQEDRTRTATRRRHH